MKTAVGVGEPDYLLVALAEDSQSDFLEDGACGHSASVDLCAVSSSVGMPVFVEDQAADDKSGF